MSLLIFKAQQMGFFDRNKQLNLHCLSILTLEKNLFRADQNKKNYQDS